MAESRSAAPLEYQTPVGSANLSILLGLIRVLALLAFGICCYLIWQSATGAAPVGCGGTSDCNELLTSTRSKWFDLPVSVPGAAVYLGILLAALAASPTAMASRQRRSWQVMVALAILAGGAAVWFIGLQIGLRRICVYCMTVHGCGLVIAAVVAIGFRRLPTGRNESSYRIKAGVRPANVLVLCILGVTGLAALVAGQWLSSKPQPVVSFGGELTTRPVRIRDTQPTTAEIGASTIPSVVTPVDPQFGRFNFPIGDEFIDLDPAELPILGNPDAEKVMAVMIDYTCSHCRNAHPMWRRIVDVFGDQLVIVILPLAMDSKHNPRIHTTAKGSIDSYDLAKIAMAVWRVDHEAFYKIDNWLFEVQPRTVKDARDYATQLIGAKVLEKAKADPAYATQFIGAKAMEQAQADPANATEFIGAKALEKAEAEPWVAQQLRRNIKIYDLDHGGQIPKVFLTKPISGQAGEIGLIRAIETELGIHHIKPVPGLKPAPRMNPPATTRPSISAPAATTPATRPATAPAVENK